jgi:hypothetical protein
MDGSDIKLYLSWKPDRVDKRLQEYLRQGDEGRARQLSQTLSSVERLWKGFIIDQSRGELISLIGDGVNRACIPADALEGVEKIRTQASRFLQSPLSVGVGLSMVDADLALQVAVKRGGDQIQLWDRETMGPELEQGDQQLQKADGPPGPKAEETPSNKGNAGGGFTSRSEGQPGEKPTPPRAEGSEHSQGEVAQAAAEEFSGPEATHGAAGGDPEQALHGHAQAQEDEDQRESDEAQSQEGVKAKVVEILKQVREAAPQLEQLQQQSPELYAVLMDMTQALILTARAMVGGDDGDQGGDDQQQEQQQPPVQKAEAGFRNKITGDIITTGSHHDLERLPGGEFNPEDFEEGFIKSDGEFLTRDEFRKLRKAWEDPKTQASMAVFQDAAMEGRGQDLGARPIPMPPGVSAKRPTARPRPPYQPWVAEPGGGRRAPLPSDPEVPREGWELTQAATQRTLGAANFNERTNTGSGYAGAEPADRAHLPYRGNRQAVIADRDWHGGFQGGWDRPETTGLDDPRSGDQRYWGAVSDSAQDLAFPLPRHDPHTGPDPHDRQWHHNWGYIGPQDELLEEDGSVRREARPAHWFISSNLRRPDDHPQGPYGGPGQPWAARAYVGPNFSVDPATGLLADPTPEDRVPEEEEDDQHGNLGARGYRHLRDQLNQYLASLKGMHKKEFSARLEKGKLPMPENAPKHKFKHPVGASKDGKVKIRHDDGTSSWVSVRAGQVLSNDGHPISSRNPDGR